MTAFFNLVKDYDLKDIISIDETSVKLGMFLNYCRSNLGKRCVLKSDTNVIFTKHSLIVAISDRRCIGYKLYDQGAVNAERFEAFLQPIANRYQNKLFILDNAQIHKSQSVKNLIRNSGNKVLYTLPYSPRLNPIEQFFNQVKH